MEKELGFIEVNKAYKSAVNNNFLKVDFSNDSVTLAIQEPIEVTLQSNWDTVFNGDGFFSGVKDLMTIGGVGVFNQGIFSKRFYKGGSYLKLQPKVRYVVETERDSTIEVVKKFVKAAAPKKYENAFKPQLDFSRFKGLKKELDDVVTNGLDPLATIVTLATFLEGIVQDNTNSNNPQPVNVSVGNYIYGTFVIENVSVTFSKEMTFNGPLYVDIQLELGTREIFTADQSENVFRSGSRNRFRVI